MAVSQAMGFDVQENLPQIGGGVVGVGAPAVLRETADLQVGPLVGDPGSTLARVSHPSVAWGLGVGGLTGVLWAMDVGPSELQDFYLAHSLTAVPTGALSALLPKQSPSTAQPQARTTRRVNQRAMSEQRSGGVGANGEFGPADGGGPETQPAQ